MTDDLLREATRALRDEHPDTEAGGDLTRARLMKSVHTRRRRRASMMSVLIPIAAVLVGGTAWGAASGKLPAAWQGMKEAVGLAEPEAVSDAKPSPPARGRVATIGERAVEAPAAVPEPAVPETEAEPEAQPEPTAAAEPTAEAAQPSPVGGRPERAAPKAPPAAAPAPIAEPDTEGAAPKDVEPETPREPDTLALYRDAHRAHFVEQSPSRALAKWDEYLRAAPRGRFATEAAYNRALCLVRLGRVGAAKAALTPFAEGRYGGYRQADAKKLIEAL